MVESVLFFCEGTRKSYIRYELWVTIFSVIIRRIIFVIEIQKANRLALVHRNFLFRRLRWKLEQKKIVFY